MEERSCGDKAPKDVYHRCVITCPNKDGTSDLRTTVNKESFRSASLLYLWYLKTHLSKPDEFTHRRCEYLARVRMLVHERFNEERTWVSHCRKSGFTVLLQGRGLVANAGSVGSSGSLRRIQRHLVALTNLLTQRRAV